MPITVSAPGKLMLLGEHAVVYGNPCLVATVGQRLFMTVSKIDESILRIVSKAVGLVNYQKDLKNVGQGDIPRGARFVEGTVKHYFEIYKFKSGLQINIKSDFSPLYGFGSSSAVIVCTLYGLSILFNQPLTLRQLFDMSYQVVQEIEGLRSGFDIAAAIWGGCLYFIGNGKVIEPIQVNDIPLIVGYSGIKADTPTQVAQVANLKRRNPQKTNRIFSEINKLVEKAKIAIIQKNWKQFGILMNSNQLFLRQLQVSTDKLELLISTALKAGAWGAKLSGAGGGDCMIAVAADDNKESVKLAITQAGGQVIEVETNVIGVRLEN